MHLFCSFVCFKSIIILFLSSFFLMRYFKIKFPFSKCSLFLSRYLEIQKINIQGILFCYWLPLLLESTYTVENFSSSFYQNMVKKLGKIAGAVIWWNCLPTFDTWFHHIMVKVISIDETWCYWASNAGRMFHKPFLFFFF